jgi:hypothetical protein
MKIEVARRKVLLLSVATTVVFACFVIVSPLFLQLDGSEALQVVQIVFPVFAGYIGASVIFIFRGNTIGEREPIDPELLRYLVYLPFVVFWSLGAAVFVYFFVSNLPNSGGKQGMSFPQLATYITIIISFMNATTGALTSILFQTDEMRKRFGAAAVDPPASLTSANVQDARTPMSSPGSG